MFCDSMMLGGGRQAAFSIPHSVRLDGVSDYFTRTPSVAGNRKTWTFSAWVKRSRFTDGGIIFSSTVSGPDTQWIYYKATNDELYWQDYVGSTRMDLISTGVFHDNAAWMHVLAVLDTTQETPSERARLYVNGMRITSFSTEVYPGQNAQLQVNTAGRGHHLGACLYSGSISAYMAGYLSQPIFVDGIALDPTYFGETDPLTGSWRPKKVNISDYGTNGFHLNFDDANDPGFDISGNANAWTPVSLGAADVVADTPTNNFFITSRLFPISYPLTISEGDLTVTTTSGSANYRALGSISPGPGKWWYRIAHPMNIGCYFGFTRPTQNFLTARYEVPGTVTGRTDEFSFRISPGTTPVAFIYACFNGNVVSLTESLPQTPANIDICFDCTDPLNGKAWIMVDGVSVAGDPVAGTAPPISGVVWSPDMLPCFVCGNPGSYQIVNGSDGTVPPTGYKALCTANMPAPAIKSPAKHFDVVTYTGNGETNVIASLGFQPDMIWLKSRSQTYGHLIIDSVRGANNYLIPNLTQAESVSANVVASIDANGFTLGSDVYANTVGSTNVAWCWKAGGAADANTAGSITSQVSANPTAGFSIVTFTKNTSSATIGHGLGATPKLIIAKQRDNPSGSSWWVYTAALGAGKLLWLNTNDASADNVNAWNSTAPTDSVFSLGSVADNYDYVAYCWAEVPGFSSFGSYTGNGSTDGPFIHCGFRPRWVLIKRRDSMGNWTIVDTQREPFNDGTWNSLQANSALAESNINADGLSNGVKIRGTGTDINANGGTYIYAAFAEFPFGGMKTTPATAR
ncbi:MAG: LamG-like jellyroll fold domain-containing protein [Magnetospirillum sp.]